MLGLPFPGEAQLKLQLQHGRKMRMGNTHINSRGKMVRCTRKASGCRRKNSAKSDSLSKDLHSAMQVHPHPSPRALADVFKYENHIRLTVCCSSASLIKSHDRDV